jgi:hypothetical protein
LTLFDEDVPIVVLEIKDLHPVPRANRGCQRLQVLIFEFGTEDMAIQPSLVDNHLHFAVLFRYYTNEKHDLWTSLVLFNNSALQQTL